MDENEGAGKGNHVQRAVQSPACTATDLATQALEAPTD